ncbi:tol-pal system protein YbgF [bacterium]|nr:tol-pal system protein YbgF [candidate division CSSED10-310 bacterium]
MRLFPALLTLIIIAGISAGCGGNQLTQIETDVIRTQKMLETDRSETHVEIESLRKDIVELKSRIDHLVKIQADTKIELDEFGDMLNRFIQVIENLKTTLARSQRFPESAGEPPGRDETTQRPEFVYQTAYSDYINRKFDLAILEFQGFLNSFPESELADNAQYWISECYYAMGRYEDAIQSFDMVITEYPDGEKLVAALLKKGLSYIELGDNQQARKILEDLINRFPFSEESRIAEDRLKNLSNQ